jgi:hypothetical protein
MSKTRLVRIVLDETQFRALVAGQVLAANVDDRRVEIILSDIGWPRMWRAVEDARRAQGAPPPDPPQAREFLPNEYTRHDYTRREDR